MSVATLAVRSVRQAGLQEVCELVGELAEALTTGQVSFHFQPRFEVFSGRVSGAEALARWHHPRHGSIPPTSFIPVAEASGLLEQLTVQALSGAIRAAKTWTSHRSALPVAVNFSPDVVHRPRVLFALLDALEREHLPPGRFEVEVTETGPVERPQVLDALWTLAESGVRIILDDFGTGYSGLSSLQALPIHAVKIDRRFIRSLHCQPRDRTMVRNMIRLVHDLGAEVIAEGVERPDTLSHLAELGCDHAQGFLLGAPDPRLPSLC